MNITPSDLANTTPCPFCGGPSAYCSLLRENFTAQDADAFAHWYACQHCGAQGPQSVTGMLHAAELWCRRVVRAAAPVLTPAPKADGEPIKDDEYFVQRFAGDGPVVVCHGPAFTLRGDDAARWLRLTANSIEHARILGERALSAAAP